jgi:hypothetical protein
MGLDKDVSACQAISVVTFTSVSLRITGEKGCLPTAGRGRVMSGPAGESGVGYVKGNALKKIN